MVLLGTLTPLGVVAPQGADRLPAEAPDSVTVVAGADYRAGKVWQWLFGGVYRDLWTTPIRVPVLDLRSFDGGLTPTEVGGRKETVSLRLETANGSEYVFRSVNKDNVGMPESLAEVKIAVKVARDQVASTHPAANLVHAPFYQAVGVIHDDDAQLFVLPDDEVLGEFREQFAGRLGVLTRFPGKRGKLPEEYAGALEIIDSDSLLQRLNRDPAERVEVDKYLASRLVEMLLNNFDRNLGNWKWARLEVGGPWHPISRDMDKVLTSRNGVLPTLLKGANPTLIAFDSTYPSLGALTSNSLPMDRRILQGTSREAFDSIAIAVRDRLTDEVIAAGVARMPVEYAPTHPGIVAKLRMRRDSIPAIADLFYRRLAERVDIHATDAAEHALITFVDSQRVDLHIEGPDHQPFLTRRFDARETREIRLYLHGGDDQATVVGTGPAGILVRVIGGNGHNQLRDESGLARVYDAGSIEDVDYGPDTLFNRRPLVAAAGGWQDPGRDYGRRATPTVDVSTNRDLGLAPQLGWRWRHYAFRTHPHTSEVKLEGRYSFRAEGFAFTLTGDKRRPESRLHYTAIARMSQLEILNYHGLGNATPASPGVPVGERAPRNSFYSVNQNQWLLHPALAHALSKDSDVRLGPVVQYTVSNGPRGGFLETTRPYGAGSFGEVGLRASLLHDSRDRSSHPRSGTIVDVRADYFPAIWDVQKAFGAVRATGGVYVTLPVPLMPYLGLRVRGQRVFGEFPFHQAAFIGGRGGVRSLEPQRFAGDASLAGKLEMRVPLVKFNLLLPLSTGVFAAQEVGRVYLDGASPDGWHKASGAGFWVGFHNYSVNVRVIQSNEVGRTSVFALQVGRTGMEQ